MHARVEPGLVYIERYYSSNSSSSIGTRGAINYEESPTTVQGRYFAQLKRLTSSVNAEPRYCVYYRMFVYVFRMSGYHYIRHSQSLRD